MIHSSTTLSASGDSPIVPLNRWQTNFSVTIACDVSTGADLTYTLQYTLDNVTRPGSNPVWFNSLDLDSETATGVTQLVSPVTAVKVSIDSYTSGTLIFTVTQGGI